MKKLYTFLFLCIGMLTFLTSCGHGDTFVIKGTLGTQKGEKILVIYDDPIAKIDTISPIEGEFEYSFIPDTTTLFRLVNKEGRFIPIIAEKGWEVDCKGTFEAPILDGNGHNHDYADFLKSIQKVENSDSITHAAETFIRKHPHSFASAYLIDHYFIQAKNPDMKKVNRLIIPLNGEVKDSRVLNVAMKSIPNENEMDKKSLNYFSLTDRNGKYISWSLKKGEYILINFWASWDKKSITARDTLHSVMKKFPKERKERIKVFNISLDYDKKQWLEACKEDTDYWIEICNFTGWETPIVKQNNILSIPSNILIDNQRAILAKDINKEELTKRLEKKGDK